MLTEYRTITGEARGEFKDKGSRFLAFAYPMAQLESLKPYLEPLQKEHHKAVHHCYAYRLGTDGLQFRANDDGEPSGSAGRPILGQIDSAELTDILVIVVRYFGGTLLGVPGLIHAYKTATSDALQAAKIITKPIEKTVYLQCEYADLSEALRIAKQHQAHVVHQDLQLTCTLVISIPLAQYATCISTLEKHRAIHIRLPENS